jgi:hypothetical protein
MGSVRFRTIWNCPTQRRPLAFECPQAWAALAETGDPGVRHCGACDRSVHLCPTPEAFVRAAEAGHCVAIPREVFPVELIAHRVGAPSAESAAAFKAELGRVVGWWDEVIARAPGALGRDLDYMRGAVAARRPEAEPHAAAGRGPISE